MTVPELLENSAPYYTNNAIQKESIYSSIINRVPFDIAAFNTTAGSQMHLYGANQSAKVSFGLGLGLPGQPIETIKGTVPQELDKLKAGLSDFHESITYDEESSRTTHLRIFAVNNRGSHRLLVAVSEDVTERASRIDQDRHDVKMLLASPCGSAQAIMKSVEKPEERFPEGAGRTAELILVG
ncbi:MAG: hypothetical protein NUV73_04285, partial [Candidatus Daviesbacteria bacterium]|nr:hypothetical protein [Candidatus Daviesbacteria bacterium]